MKAEKKSIHIKMSFDEAKRIQKNILTAELLLLETRNILKNQLKAETEMLRNILCKKAVALGLTVKRLLSLLPYVEKKRGIEQEIFELRERIKELSKQLA